MMQPCLCVSVKTISPWEMEKSMEYIQRFIPINIVRISYILEGRSNKISLHYLLILMPLTLCITRHQIGWSNSFEVYLI